MGDLSAALSSALARLASALRTLHPPEDFVQAMQSVREMRRRNGAYFWQLSHHSEDPARFVETFMDESWLDHLRRHERESVADRDVLRRAKEFLVEGESTRSVALVRGARVVARVAAVRSPQFTQA